jgi:hypothetical protein
MGRPRQYASDAERQRAFRRRRDEEWARVDRGALERHNARLDRLQAAIRAAAAAGDATARACAAASVDTVLEQLIRHFTACADRGAARPDPPPAPPSPPEGRSSPSGSRRRR